LSDNKLQKRIPSAIKEKGQYVLAFGVIASMLLVVGFPTFVVFFFGVFAYFLWKIFSSASRNETREIFEFYLAANDILRNDERRWFGFEIKDVTGRGENILKNMSGAPPLVYFALGALYSKVGDYDAAVRNLSVVVENEAADEKSIVFPSPELRNYVRILRKVEREPTEAPLTSRAVRALERARRNRAKALLENSREMLKLAAKVEVKQVPAPQPPVQEHGLLDRPLVEEAANGKEHSGERTPVSFNEPKSKGKPHENDGSHDGPFADRKSISEVLHDIYDRNIQ